MTTWNFDPDLLVDKLPGGEEVIEGIPYRRWIGDQLCAVRQAAHSADGREVVGMWWRRGDELEFEQPGNIYAGSDVGFELDPLPLLQREKGGWSLVALAHSHPGGRPTPSQTDVKQLRLLGEGLRAFIWAANEDDASGWTCYEYDRQGSSWQVAHLLVTI